MTSAFAQFLTIRQELAQLLDLTTCFVFNVSVLEVPSLCVQRVTSMSDCSISNDGTIIKSYSDTTDTAGAIGVILVTIAIALLVSLVSWGVYAVKNPSSPSGQWLVEVISIFLLFWQSVIAVRRIDTSILTLCLI